MDFSWPMETRIVNLNMAYLSVLLGFAIPTFLIWRASLMVKSKRWKKVGNLSTIFIHPLKSGSPIQMEECYLNFGGIESKDERLRDRSFMIVNSESMTYLNVRRYPLISTIRLEYRDGKYVLKSSQKDDSVCFDLSVCDKRSVTGKLWDVSISNLIDCGDEAAIWISDFILEKKDGVRLLCSPRR